KLLAKRAGYSLKQVETILQKLHSLKVIDYKPATGLPKVEFVGGRVRKQDIHISKDIYENRIKLIKERIAAAIHFVETDKVCRSQMLLKYFGETESKHCGKCDVCRGLIKVEDADVDLQAIRSAIVHETAIEELINKLNIHPEKTILKGVQTLLDNNELTYNMNGKIQLSE
ncbi:MAG: RecQ family zinc-binding domain-containing protein, partial [Flavobacteriales bacterium]|nr:RecQ family zinc-binding domain-containing protein [Flavobacteriales bacterium]